MMHAETPTAPRSRAAETLQVVADQYGTRGDLEALRLAGDDWCDEALAQIVEGLAALLIEVRPRTGAAVRVSRGRQCRHAQDPSCDERRSERSLWPGAPAAVHNEPWHGGTASEPRSSRSALYLGGPGYSITATSKAHVLLLPDGSVAVHCTTFVPMGKSDPDGGSHSTGTEFWQLSDAVIEKVTTAPVGEVACIGVRSPGQSSTGSVSSATVTSKLHESPLDPVQVTVVVPLGKSEPAGGLQVAPAGVG
jgi:hypothetical protein